MGSQDSQERGDSKPGGLKEKYDELERLVRDASPSIPGKETLEEFIDGQSEKEAGEQGD
jgi:hypothetical protein